MSALKKGLHILLASLVLLSACASKGNETARSVYQKAKSSVVSILMKSEGDKEYELIGSGFAINDPQPLIVTAKHVAEGDDDPATKDEFELKTLDGKIEHISLIKKSDKNDVAFFKIDNKYFTIPALKIASTDPEIGSDVFVVGHPSPIPDKTYFWWLSVGVVNGYDKSSSDGATMGISAPLVGGNSGGPILDSNADVVGIAIGTWRTANNLNFSLPASIIKLELPH